MEELPPIEPEEPYTRRAGERNWFSPHTNTLWVETAIDQISNHEMNHLLAHAGTPYGFFLQTLVDLQTRVAADYFEQTWLHLPHLRIPVPVQQFARRQSNLAGELGTFVDRYVKPWSWLVFLERIFEGTDLPSVRGAKRRDGLRALHQFESLFESRLGATSDAIKKPEPVQEPPADLDRPACMPGKWFRNKIFPIGAAHVMETLARQVQADFMEPGARPQEGDFQQPGAELYWFFYLKTAERLGLDRMRTVEGYRKLYNTIVAMSDLALFAPVGPVYGQLRNPGCRWEDVHPGLRYIKCLLALDTAVGWIDDIKTGLAPFQQSLCETFGWPTPDSCLHLGMSIDSKLPTWRRHREACELRRKNPIAFLFIERSHFYDDFLDRNLPILYHPDVGEVVVRSTDGEGLTLLVNHFLPKWIWQIMNQTIPDYHSLLPERIRLDRLAYSNLTTASEFVDILKRDNGWLDSGRFVPLAQ